MKHFALEPMEAAMAKERKMFLETESENYRLVAISRDGLMVTREFSPGELRRAIDAAHDYWMKRFLYVECFCKGSDGSLNLQFHAVRNW